jgi:RHS repeat-associated protein
MLHKLAWSGCTANCPNGWGSYAYAYDQFGNRWQQVVNSGQGPAPSYTFTNSNQITGSGVSYDPSGDMTADDFGNTYSYDALRRLTAIGGRNTAASYVYDAFGNRVEENPAWGGSGYATDMIFDLNNRPLHRATPANSAWGMEVYAGRHLGLYVNGNFYMDYKNQVSTTRMWTAYSSSGSNSIQTCTELPFGDARTCAGGSIDQDFFGDFRIDVDGEYASPTRRLATTQGRWQVPDPAGLAAVDVTNPQTWNRYAYVENNPVSFADPTGLVRTPWGAVGSNVSFGWNMFYLFDEGSFCGGGGECRGYMIGNGLTAALYYSGLPGSSPAANNGPTVPKNPCQYQGRALAPSDYASMGKNTNLLNFALDVHYGWGTGQYMDAQPLTSVPGTWNAAAYGNYVYGVYMQAASAPLSVTLRGAEGYAARKTYPLGTPMQPGYPGLPSANAQNIINGYNAQANGTTCQAATPPSPPPGG